MPSQERRRAPIHHNACIRIIATATAEQQNEHDNEQDDSHVDTVLADSGQRPRRIRDLIRCGPAMSRAQLQRIFNSRSSNSRQIRSSQAVTPAFARPAPLPRSRAVALPP